MCADVPLTITHSLTLPTTENTLFLEKNTRKWRFDSKSTGANGSDRFDDVFERTRWRDDVSPAPSGLQIDTNQFFSRRLHSS